MRAAVAIALALAVQAPAPLTLRIRVFDGTGEVTGETRVNVFKAGERQSAIAELRGPSAIELAVAPGIYDAQVIREQDGRVLNIRWAERLIVMPYPDENGQHLEVINFQNGFGALEIRGRGPGPPEVAIFAAGSRQQESARRIDAPTYALFVVPAGRYDVRLRRGADVSWHADIEVPGDRTRLWIAPGP